MGCSTSLHKDLLLNCRALQHDASDPILKFPERQLTLQAVAFLAVADLSVEGGQQVESYVGGLKVPGIGLGDVCR